MKNLTRVTILALCISISCSIASAQTAPEIEWQNTIGGYDEDYLRAMIQTSDGGYLLGGYSYSDISGDKAEVSQGGSDYWVVKLNGSGNIQWQNTIGGDHFDRLYSVIQTTDGGYLLGGHSYSGISGDKTEASQGDYDYWVVKLDESGNIQWQNTIGGYDEDNLYSVVETTDGGYLLGGSSTSGNTGDKTEESQGLNDYWVVKLNGSGNIQWQNTIGGDNGDPLYSMIQTTDGGYLLGGTSFSDSSGDKTEAGVGYWVVKLDESGNILWQNALGDYGFGDLRSLIQVTDGGYLLGGSSDFGNGGYNYWVVKLNGSGNILWQNTIGGNDEDYLQSVIQTADSGYLLGGYSASGISGDKTEACQGNFDYWVVKLDGSGNILWQNTIGGDDVERLYSVIQIIDGGYLLGGYSWSGISGDKTGASQGESDYWVVKLSVEGAVECQLPTGLSANNITPTTATLHWDAVPWAFGYRVRYKQAGTSQWNLTSSTGNEITITGLTPNTEYGWKVKSICSESPVISSDSSAQAKFTTAPMRWGTGYQSIFEVYPNPISQTATISFSLNEESLVAIQMMDVNGRSLKVIAQQDFSQGSHEVTFNRESLSTGIYFIQLKTKEGVIMKKLVIE